MSLRTPSPVLKLGGESDVTEEAAVTIEVGILLFEGADEMDWSDPTAVLGAD
jgi:hypothetical protein